MARTITARRLTKGQRRWILDQRREQERHRRAAQIMRSIHEAGAR